MPFCPQRTPVLQERLDVARGGQADRLRQRCILLGTSLTFVLVRLRLADLLLDPLDPVATVLLDGLQDMVTLATLAVLLLDQGGDPRLAAVDGLPPVGDVTVTPIDGDNLMFSWHLFGVAGSERFVVLARNSCVTVGGQSVGLAGQWYAPTQSGYGMDVVAEPQLQFDAFYLYDSLGQPRWLIASDGPFAPTMSVALNQVSGFCPTCAYVPTTLQPVGTLNVSYSDASSGTFSTNCESGGAVEWDVQHQSADGAVDGSLFLQSMTHWIPCRFSDAFAAFAFDFSFVFLLLVIPAEAGIQRLCL